MKLLIVSFLIFILVAPAAVALFLIFRFYTLQVPDLYFVFVSLGLCFSVLTMVWGRFWLEPFLSQLPIVPKVSATDKFNSGEKV